MSTTTAQYIAFISGQSGSTTEIREATLTDSDLVRGNDEGETIVSPFGEPIFNGFTRFVQTGTSLDSVVRVFDDGEVTTTVTFSDGSTLSGVEGLLDQQVFSFGTSVTNFILDVDALAAAGKTLEDIVDIDVDAFVDHDLNYSDFGFGSDPITPPEPDPVPALDTIEGTSGNDRLVGTDADEIILGGNGNDTLTGGAGEDVFVFGADASDGGRDRDVVRDFDVTEDVLVLEDGASIRSITERNGNTTIRLDDDRDVIVLRGVEDFSAEDIVFADDSFLG